MRKKDGAIKNIDKFLFGNDLFGLKIQPWQISYKPACQSCGIVRQSYRGTLERKALLKDHGWVLVTEREGSLMMKKITNLLTLFCPFRQTYQLTTVSHRSPGDDSQTRCSRVSSSRASRGKAWRPPGRWHSRSSRSGSLLSSCWRRPRLSM